MKNLFRLLIASISIFTLVTLALAIKTISDNPVYFNSISIDSGTKDTSLTFDDVLQKVTGTISSLSASDQDNLKADLKVNDGTGNLVTEDAVVQETATTKAKASSTETYTFSEEMYPYRAMLTVEQKVVYDQIYNNAVKLNTYFKVNSSIDKEGLDLAMTAVYDDHPELFWLDTNYSYGYTSKGTIVSVTLSFNDTANNISDSKNKFNSITNTIIANTSGLSSALEKEKYVYKYLMNIVTYDEKSVLNQSAYSAVVNGRSVCAGYSRAFQYIMMQLDIPCYFASGYANNNYHAWNIVKIDGVFHNVDLSWDDSLGDANATYSFQYFNISDKVFSIDHKRQDMSLKLPVCY